MPHIRLVTATDLEQWAALLEGQAAFPELLRRLILFTAPRLSSIGFSSGEGVLLGGWDGLSECATATPFVPLGVAGWELGTNQNSKGKADSDYLKRTNDPLGLSIADSTFIFCTPRRWSKKEKWATTRRAEGQWGDVRVYDADDLITWLSTAPSVHIWLSTLLGKLPAGVEDLSTFWQDWASVITPVLPEALLLAGRKSTSEALHNWLTNPDRPFSLVADSRREAVAILASAVLTLAEPERTRVLARTVIAHSETAWYELTSTGVPMLLVPLFRNDEAVASAVRHGHQVFLALDRTDILRSAHQPTRLVRSEAVRVLQQYGFPSNQIDALAGLARRSLAAFRRHRALQPLITTSPSWATAAFAPVLLAAALVGAWSEEGQEAAGDQAVVAALAGLPYDQVSAQLKELVNSVEPPVRLIGSTWYAVDKADIWSLLARYQSSTLFDRFTEAVLHILGTALPRYELPLDQQLDAQLYGKFSPHSGFLRQRIADSIAFLGADDDSPTDVRRGVDYIVQELLRRANVQPAIWLSVASYLPRLAEASPNEFLLGVSAGLRGGDPPVMVLFQERPGISFPTAEHPGLLWGMELVAWSSAYLGQATRLLACLHELDPRGNLINRPLNSLVSIFMPRFPRTSATLDERLAALDALRQASPETAWALMLRLLPTHVRDITEIQVPAWRDWAPAERSQGGAHYHTAVDAIIERVVQDAAAAPTRWLALVPELPVIHSPYREYVMQALRHLPLTITDAPTRHLLVRELRELIHNQRSLEKNERHLLPKELRKLEAIYSELLPEDLLQRSAWLFDAWPKLLSGERYRGQEALKKYEQKIADARQKALSALLPVTGITGIVDLVPLVEAPSYLGKTLGERTDVAVEDKDALLTRYLASTEIAEQSFAHGLAVAYRLLQPDPWGWATAQVRNHQNIWSPSQQAAWLDAFPTAQTTWHLAAELGAETERCYWEQASPYGINVADIATAFAHLQRFGRPVAALYLAHLYKEVPLPAEAQMDALETFFSGSATKEPRLPFARHEVTELLSRLADAPQLDEARVARLEFEMLPAQFERRIPAKALYRALGNSPAFFAELVQMFTSSEDGVNPPTVDDDRRLKAYKLLHKWSILPGTQSDGTLNAQQLKEWVLAAQAATAAVGRARRGQELIGEMLSASPTGNDGFWPHEAVRVAIEALDSDNVEHGFRIGTLNNRGSTVRNPYAGGVQERHVAAMFDAAAAAMALDSLRTAGVLRRLASEYKDRAAREDNEADLEHDLDC